MERDIIAELKTRRQAIWAEREPMFGELGRRFITYGGAHNEVSIQTRRIMDLTHDIQRIDAALEEIAKLA